MTAPTQDLGIWRRTSLGYVADASTIKAHGGSRKVALPGSTLRIADLEWVPLEDVNGKVIAWRRIVCGGWVVIRNDTVASSAESLETPWRMSFTKEEPMSKKTKDAAPQAQPKEPKAPKPIAYEPSGEIKAAKVGSKLAALIDALAAGATMEELVKVLSQTGSAVDASGVRSWLSYDLRRTGLGVRQDGDVLHLVGTPLPHRDATAKKAPEATVAEPKLQIVKKAAGSSKPKSKKAKASVK